MGLEGRTGWSKDWGKAGFEGGVPEWPPKLAQACRGATRSTHLKTFKSLPHDDEMCMDKASAFHNLIFDAVPSKRMLGIETICIC